MPSFGVSVPHPLSKEDAIERLRKFATTLHEQHRDHVKDVEQRWEDDQLVFSFVTTGMSISGSIRVEDKLAHVQGKLPFAAVLFRGRIEKEIRAQLADLLR